MLSLVNRTDLSYTESDIDTTLIRCVLGFVIGVLFIILTQKVSVCVCVYCVYVYILCVYVYTVYVYVLGFVIEVFFVILTQKVSVCTGVCVHIYILLKR